jgi:uncharacterized protein (TIGR03083 family)
MLSVSDHVAAIRREGDLIVAALRGAQLDTMVPTCPEWTVRELAHHTGRTHHWAAANIEQPRATPLSSEEEAAAWGDMPDDAGTPDWYRAANERLVRALTGAPADVACWSFLPAPSPLAFWARRQAHEAAIHRVDAELGAGRAVSPLDEEFALDGIDELICGFYSRKGGRLRSETPRTLAVTAGGRTWRVHIGPDGPRGEPGEGPSDGAVEGRADAVYLALWNRGRLTDLEVTGDADVVTLWSQKATIRWSS